MIKVPSDSEEAIDVYLRAADENRTDALLKGSLLHFPNYGQVVMTGDIHGHVGNFEKLVKFCVLGQSKGRHVLLHELIHREPQQLDEIDLSHELLFEAAHWKCAFPNQVHFLQANHELAQLSGQEITKNGRDVTKAFEEGVAHTFGRNQVTRVMEAIAEFLSTLPLAARTPNGLFMSHSLPNVEDWPTFERNVLDRPLRVEDLVETGAVYQMVWGRRHSPQLLEEMAKAFDVEIFLTGHQPQEQGFEVAHDRLLILASDHNHGVFLPINLRKKKYTMDELTKALRKFVSVA